jgi:hypothetical protein
MAKSNNKYMIATIKSWNIDVAKKFIAGLSKKGPSGGEFCR